jgi:hypothetical protein
MTKQQIGMLPKITIAMLCIATIGNAIYAKLLQDRIVKLEQYNIFHDYSDKNAFEFHALLPKFPKLPYNTYHKKYDLMLIHDMYSDLHTSYGGMSCCGNKDCGPVEFENVVADGKIGVIFHVLNKELGKSYDVFVPENRVQRKVVDKDHPERAVWCGRLDEFFGPLTICAFAPPPSV